MNIIYDEDTDTLRIEFPGRPALKNEHDGIITHLTVDGKLVALE